MSGDRLELPVLVDSTDTDRENAEERKLIGKGFTKGRGWRKIASVELDEIVALAWKGDFDAIDYLKSGGADKKATRALILKNPQWRCSEGAI